MNSSSRQFWQITAIVIISAGILLMGLGGYFNRLSNILLENETDQIVKSCINILNKRKYSKNKLKIKGNVGILLVNKIKELNIELDAYLNINEKPSKLRAWLEAEYTDTDGVKKQKYFIDFIEVNGIAFGKGLSGLINSTEKLKVKIPKVNKWLESDCKVSLFVGLVKEQVTKPSSSKGRNLIISDMKVLEYKE